MVAIFRSLEGESLEDYSIRLAERWRIGQKSLDNGVILLAGQTPRAELRDQAEQAARLVVGVEKVHNELQIQQPASALARSNDSLLTTRIKSSMLVTSGVPSSHIKVVTENGIVYLMGIVTRAQANQATAVAQNVSGVQRIVRLFQYTD